MGCSYLSDLVTGQTFREGDPVVGVVIARRVGGFPDAEKAAALPGMDPDHLFGPVSLPIKGVAGQYCDIIPDEGQASVDLLLGMTHSPDWEHFAARAFDFEKGIAIERNGITGENARAQVLGLAVLSAATWDHLLNFHPDRAERSKEIALVKLAMLDAAGSGSADDFLRGQADQILGLRFGSGSYEFADGTRHSMPPLAHVLDANYGGITQPLTRHLLFGSKKLYWDLYAAGSAGVDHGWIEEVLGSLWDYTAFRYGLQGLNRYLLPSASGHQTNNDEHIAGLGLISAAQGLAAALESAVEYDSVERLDPLQKLADEIGVLHQSFLEKIAAARQVFDGGMRP
jgi:hypothetical protein